MNKERLLAAARAVREGGAREKFTMHKFAYDCGTPACVLARPDLQDAFQLKKNHYGLFDVAGRQLWLDDSIFREHFDLARGAIEELFGETGCDHALSPEEAAQYIENFVKENE